MYGIKDSEFELLQSVFKKHENIEKVVLYGSRAKGNYKPFSDVDITLFGEKLSHSDLNKIALDVDDLLLPYQFDISIFKSLKNKDLIEHILRVGIVVYELSPVCS
ncbi:MAG: nucleotidyltransferase domain-containing protein [Bacteroidales bacterium]|nr:nucleotidyltransferase domain-containing protein [Bacteroidales bacterium]